MKKALITGISGFVGSHLTNHLLKNDIEVHGFFHPDHPAKNPVDFEKKVSIVPCDVMDVQKVKENISKINPDYVFHLAAYASPAISFEKPKETLENNIIGQLNILDALADTNSEARILVVGSADEYGSIDQKYLPADENTPLLPSSPYAVSKVAQDMLGYQYFLSKKLNIVRVRPFNHIGPRQSPDFVVPSFASQIARLEKKGGGVLKVGSLESYRDFTDVRDMVKAYLLALDKGEFGEVYNLGSAKPVKIADVLKTLLSFAKVEIKVEEDKSRLRPVEIKMVSCNYDKFKNKTGWQPEIPLETTLFDTIEYERSKLS